MVGLGNVLSVYAYYYIYAMYNKTDFNFKDYILAIDWKIKAKEAFQLKKKDKMLSHLPWIIPYNPDLFIDEAINKIENIETCGLFFHLRYYGILENIDIVRPIFQKVIDSYQPIKFNFHKNDVVIHVRTGDIFSNKHQQYYSSIHFSEYVKILRNKTINKIYIIWKSDRKQDSKYDKYNFAMINHLQKYLEDKLSVSVITESPYKDDFVFMSNAPFLIACISTYSMWAALLNSNYSIIPQCLNHFNNRIYKCDTFEITHLKTVNKYKSDISEFCKQFTEHHC